MDLNNDGLNDVIFEGASSGEAQHIKILINTGKVYKLIFDDIQHVQKIDWENNKITRLYIHDWGCCDDYEEFKKIYAVSFNNNNIPQFKQVYQGVSIFESPEPDSLFKNSVRFEVLNDNYNMRSGPFIDEMSYQHWDSTAKGTGNTFCKLPEGAKGTAIGWQEDNTGRQWWYVEIDEQYKPRSNYLYDNENNFPTKLIGWISSRFIKKL